MVQLRLRPGPFSSSRTVRRTRQREPMDSLPDTRKLMPCPSSGSAGPPPAASAPPGGARGGLAVARWAPRPSLWCLGSGGSRGALPRRGGATRGAGAAGPAGWGWMGGQLPEAVREDVATAPRRPSAPETPSRLSPEPPCLRRPQPGSGPSPPVPGAGRAGGRGR